MIPPRIRAGAFTLIELMVVIGMIVLLTSFLAPAFPSLKRAGAVTAAAETIAGTLAHARSYAMAKNTYTWVGFYEESAKSTIATNIPPPYPGKGRLLLAIVKSRDGTPIFDESDPSAPLPADRISQVGKLVKLEGIHATDIGPPASPPSNRTSQSHGLNGRSDLPYTYAASLNADHFNRISSDSDDKTKFSFTAQGYTFYKTVRFNPRGEANLNSTYSLRVTAEMGLVPTHGDVAPTPSPAGLRQTGNVAAIQFSGAGGNFKIYRP